jgi:hypothetical protein
MRLMTKETDIDHRLITKYHPQANGLAERFVQTACRAIHKLLEGEDRQWDRYVPSVQLYINSKVASIHNSAPFSIMFGRKLNPFADFQDSQVQETFSSATEDYHRIRDRIPFFTDILFPAILEKESGNAAKAIVNFAKAKRILKEPFPAGSFVMLHDPTRSNKNRAVYEGLFKVLERTRGGSYRLLDHDQSLHPRAVAPSQLKLVSKDPSHDPVSLVVDRVLDHRGPPSKRHYLVRWKHLPDTENSWEPAKNFDDDQIIADYWATLHDRPDPISGGGDVVPPQTLNTKTTSRPLAAPVEGPAGGRTRSSSASQVHAGGQAGGGAGGRFPKHRPPVIAGGRARGRAGGRVPRP